MVTLRALGHTRGAQKTLSFSFDGGLYLSGPVSHTRAQLISMARQGAAMLTMKARRGKAQLMRMVWSHSPRVQRKLKGSPALGEGGDCPSSRTHRRCGSSSRLCIEFFSIESFWARNPGMQEKGTPRFLFLGSWLPGLIIFLSSVLPPRTQRELGTSGC